MEEVLEPEQASARLAPWSVVLMVASAVALTIGAVLEMWPLAALAGLVGLVGVLLLAFLAVSDGASQPMRR